MKEVFEKIIEALSEKKDASEKDMELSDVLSDASFYGGMHDAYEKSIEIVNQTAAEYNNGWIPCSVAMPEERDSMFAKLKGTRKWNDSMFEKISEEVNVTISDENGDKVTTHAYTTDGKWKCDLLRFNDGYSVISWQPLPEPYQPKGE